MVQMVEPETAPDPEGGPGGRRIKKPVAPDRRSSIEDKARRHGRKSRAKTFHGCKEPVGLALDRNLQRVPHVRGDEPTVRPSLPMNARCSPRAWG